MTHDWERRFPAGGTAVVLVSLVVVALLTTWAMRGPEPLTPVGGQGTHAATPLVMYCAAGVKPPVEAAAKAYAEESFGRPVRLQYDGSGKLLAAIEVVDKGDLYLAADESYIEIGREKGLLAESIPVARMRPVIAVAAGNPQDIQTIDDLLRDDVRFVLCNPEAASIGKLTKSKLVESGQWEAVAAAATVYKPTVTEAAADVLLGAVDAAVLWDATVRQHSEKLEAVDVPILNAAEKNVTVAVLRSCRQPTEALRFARYLQAPEKGQPYFEHHGYGAVDGDAWAETPELTLYSGGVNRIAVTETLKAFEQREGARLNVVYNGCGILVGMMKTGETPDAYFACDASFMNDVADRFDSPVVLSETDMVVIVANDNPQGIETAEDLARPGLKVGVANPQQSALGALTQRMFEQVEYEAKDLYTAITPNVAVQTPTADLLVNQLLVGGLDAAIVYRANLSQVLDKLTVIEIDLPEAQAVQPIAAANDSGRKHLAGRLIERLQSESSRTAFERAGFRWKLAAGQP